MRYYQTSSGIVYPEKNVDAHGRESLTPVVVIDPEEPEQVQRLTVELTIHGGWREIQAALRSLIEPPKPDEPTGVGAVVEDAQGRRWVRADAEDPAALYWHNGREAAWESYERIAAVKVLSEGVR